MPPQSQPRPTKSEMNIPKVPKAVGEAHALLATLSHIEKHPVV